MGKRVLMIGTDPASKGGISSVITMYAEAGLLEKISFLASYTDGSWWHKGWHYIDFLRRYLWMLLSCPSLRIIHVHSASYGSFARKSLVILLARAFGKKVLIHIHGAEFNLFYERSHVFLQAFIRSVLRTSDVIIALSDQWKNDLQHLSGHPDVRVLYNPTIMRDPLLTRDGEAVNFLFMGRLGERKGVYDIIESARRIQSPQVRIRLYGDGDLENVREAIVAAGVEDKVHVCGWIDGNRKDEAFRQADVLLLPSYNEGLPISVLEAMAYGLPVLVTDVGGIPEAVEDGVNGFLLCPGACEQLASRMEELASEPELRRRMGKVGHEIAARKFALSVIVRQLEGLYDELIA